MTTNSSGFVSGTLIHSTNRLIPIEKIQVGDLVLSKPENGEGEPYYKRVINIFEFDEKEVWYVSYAVFFKVVVTIDRFKRPVFLTL